MEFAYLASLYVSTAMYNETHDIASAVRAELQQCVLHEGVLVATDVFVDDISPRILDLTDQAPPTLILENFGTPYQLVAPFYTPPSHNYLNLLEHGATPEDVVTMNAILHSDDFSSRRTTRAGTSIHNLTWSEIPYEERCKSHSMFCLGTNTQLYIMLTHYSGF